ncbi:UvrB/UvrC motif-containing protein [Candidatus Poribacteria bacterium]|nr:UvrB/UvrC motif-containing protein [Candidatus Poribacteria bacterium]
MEHGRKIRVVTQKGTFYLDVDGRPDGSEPILPRYLKQKTQSLSEGWDCFSLDDADVQQLSEEAFLYRLRREYFFKVGDYVRCIRDVNTGIQIIDLITACANNPELSTFFLQFRPDQEIFRRTAEAKLAIVQKDYSLARQRIELAGSFIREFAHIHSDSFPETWLEQRLSQLKKVYDDIGEAWENDVSPLRNSPSSLEEQLRAAIHSEEYERAAELRDMIRKRANPR